MGRLIDANALLKWLEECADEKEWLVSQYNADWIYSMLESAPTVDAVEEVHGRWQERYTPNGKYVAWDGFYCSVCGRRAARTNYCPNCGAKMDGGNEDGNL